MVWVYAGIGIVVLFLFICVLLNKHHVGELDRQFLQAVDIAWKDKGTIDADEKDSIADDVLTKLYWQNARDGIEFRACGEALSRVAPMVIKDREFLSGFFDSYMRWGERVGANVVVQRKVYKWFKSALPGYVVFNGIYGGQD